MGAADLGDDSLHVHHYKRLTFFHSLFDTYIVI